MSLPPSGWSFEGLQATQPIEGLDSEQPQEEPPQVRPTDEEYPEDEEDQEYQEDQEDQEDPDDASILSGGDSAEVQRMVEADGKEITEILTKFTKQLKVVEANTEKLAEHARSLNETVVKIAINSRNMHEQLVAVKASTTEMQASMAAMEERNRLHEAGTHSIRFHTQNMAEQAEKMGKEMDLHQIAIFKQQSTIFKALRRIDERLERLNNDQPVALEASLHAAENAALTLAASEKNFGNLSLNQFSILIVFMVILILAAYKYYEIILAS